MSKLDYVTIGIVAVCVAALIYLIYMTTNLLGGSKEPERVEEPLPLYDDDFADMDTSYLYSDADRGWEDGEREGRTEDLSRYDEPSVQSPAARTTPAAPAQPAPSAPAPRAPAAAAQGGFMVLAGTFAVPENAEAMVRKLNELGYTGAAIEPFDRGKFSVVLVARFDALSQARSLAEELKGKGVEAYVKRKR